MLYHQVTLGSVGWWRDLRREPGAARHPTLEDGVVVGTNASVLGPVTIGARSHVGAHAVVLESIPPDSRVSARATPAVITGMPGRARSVRDTPNRSGRAGRQKAAGGNALGSADDTMIRGTGTR